MFMWKEKLSVMILCCKYLCCVKVFVCCTVRFAFRFFSYYPFSLFKFSLDAGLMPLEIEFLRYNKRTHSSFKSFKSVKMPRKGLMTQDLSKLDVTKRHPLFPELYLENLQ